MAAQQAESGDPAGQQPGPNAPRVERPATATVTATTTAVPIPWPHSATAMGVTRRAATPATTSDDPLWVVPGRPGTTRASARSADRGALPVPSRHGARAPAGGPDRAGLRCAGGSTGVALLLSADAAMMRR